MAVLRCVPCQGAPVGSRDGLGFSLSQLRRGGVCGIVASKTRSTRSPCAAAPHAIVSTLAF